MNGSPLLRPVSKICNSTNCLALLMRSQCVRGALEGGHKWEFLGLSNICMAGERTENEMRFKPRTGKDVVGQHLDRGSCTEYFLCRPINEDFKHGMLEISNKRPKHRCYHLNSADDINLGRRLLLPARSIVTKTGVEITAMAAAVADQELFQIKDWRSSQYDYFILLKEKNLYHPETQKPFRTRYFSEVPNYILEISKYK